MGPRTIGVAVRSRLADPPDGAAVADEIAASQPSSSHPSASLLDRRGRSPSVRVASEFEAIEQCELPEPAALARVIRLNQVFLLGCGAWCKFGVM
jgi:hypothetical protein